MNYKLRPLRLPDDYEGIANLLNQYGSEPTTAVKLRDDDAKLYEVGHTWMDDNGLLAGYDRERQVAVTEEGKIVGYLWTWRAPWTEPGYLCNTLVVDRSHRKQGIGGLLLRHTVEWGKKIGATKLVTEVWDDDPDALQFAVSRGFEVERHAFQSVLDIGDHHKPVDSDVILKLEHEGIRLITLADAPGEESERKLYALYQETLVDIPGYMGEVPQIEEWKQWYLKVEGFAPEQVIIAAAGDRYVGVTNVLHNPQSNGMYHEYTGVSRNYRGKKIALALKIKAIELAHNRKADYIRTDNDSLNEPILAINRHLGYVPLRGSYRIIASLHDVLEHLEAASSAAVPKHN